MPHRIVLLCLVAALGLGSAAAAASTPDDLAFAILRDGSEIGRRTTTFERRGEALTVRTEVDIEVRIAFVTVYRRTETHVETWENGSLVSFSGRTDDDGDRFRIAAERTPDGLRIDGADGVEVAPAGTLPATFWNVATVEAAHLFDVKKGGILGIDAVTLGREHVDIRGRRVPATRYRLHGEEPRDLWYTDDGTLVRVAFRARDDSEIAYVPLGAQSEPERHIPEIRGAR